MESVASPRTPFYRRKPSRLALGIGACLLAMLIVLLLLFDWNWFKPPLQSAVKAYTGRDFVIKGNLDVDLGRVATISGEQLVFGNAQWAKQTVMASADRAQLKVEIWPLIFRREVRLPEIRLTAPVLHLETGPDGKGNWVFGDDTAGKPPQMRALWIERGKLDFQDLRHRTRIDVTIDSVAGSTPGMAPPVRIEGNGQWAGNRFTLAGTAESPLELRNQAEPYRIDLRARAGRTQAHARGNLVNPFQFENFKLRFALAGQDLQDLYPLLGIALPSTPPYRLDGQLGRNGNTWRYDRFGGVVGDSDLGGSAAITVGRERPLLVADLVSRRLDFDDLAGFLGAAPQTGGNEASNPETRARAAQELADPRLLPHTPYNLEKLRSMDADVRLKAQRINAPNLPLDHMQAHLKLEAGLLQLAPLNFGVAGGDIRSTIQMDARSADIRTNADITARRLDLSKLFPKVELTRDAVGRLSGHARLSGNGNSIAAMLGSANGDVSLGMGHGQISNLLMELAGLDIAESLKFLVTQDRKVPIRCAFGDFAVKDGLMQARALALDTADTLIVGKGDISLKHETLDLELRPRPKDRSILALRSPLVVDGTFKDPSFRPDFKRLGLRGAIAVALGSIAPPAALLATLELGPGKDSTCGGQYAK